MDDNISRLLMEMVNISDEDKIYSKAQEKVAQETNNLEADSGEIEFEDYTEAECAKSILEEGGYPSVELEETAEKITVTFSRTETESLSSWEILPDKNPKNFVGNKITGDIAPASTGGMAMGESLDDDINPEFELYCPECSAPLRYIGCQANFMEYNCDDCGEWVYIDPDDPTTLYTAEEAFGTTPFEEAFSYLTEDGYNMGKGYKLTRNYSEFEFKNNLTKDIEETIKKVFGIDKVGCYFISNKGRYIPGQYEINIFSIRKIKATQLKEIIEDLLESKYNATDIRFNVGYSGKFYVPTFSFKFHIDRPVTESIEKHDTLNPDLFENNEMRPEVKDKLLQIVDNFKKCLEDDEIKLDVKDVVVVGSNASYNFTDKSDIDLHILADLSVYDDMEDLAQKLYNAYKTLWNNKYDPMIRGHEVELYVEPYEEASVEDDLLGVIGESYLVEAVSNGVYSLYNGWVKKPQPALIPDKTDIDDQVKEYETKANNCVTVEEIDDFIDNIYILRQSSILKDGEYGEGNLIFKELRNHGVIQDLKDKKVKLQNKEMSL